MLILLFLEARSQLHGWGSPRRAEWHKTHTCYVNDRQTWSQVDKAPKELRYRTEAKRSMNHNRPNLPQHFVWLRLAWFSLFLLAYIGAWTRRGQKMKTPAERDQRSKRPSTDRMFRTIRVHLVFLLVQGFKRSWRTLKKISGCFNTPCMEIHWPKRICRLCTLGGHVHWPFTRCCTCM